MYFDEYEDSAKRNQDSGEHRKRVQYNAYGRDERHQNDQKQTDVGRQSRVDNVHVFSEAVHYTADRGRVEERDRSAQDGTEQC